MVAFTTTLPIFPGNILKIIVGTMRHSFTAHGTNNDVHLTIIGTKNKQTFNLDTDGDDFENGNVDHFDYKAGTYRDFGDKVG